MNKIEFLNLCLDNGMPMFLGLNYNSDRTLAVSVANVNVILRGYRANPSYGGWHRASKPIEKLPSPPYLVVWYNEEHIYPAVVQISIIGENKTWAQIFELQFRGFYESGNQPLIEFVNNRLIPFIISSGERYFMHARAHSLAGKVPESFDPNEVIEKQFVADVRKNFQFIK